MHALQSDRGLGLQASQRDLAGAGQRVASRGDNHQLLVPDDLDVEQVVGQRRADDGNEMLQARLMSYADTHLHRLGVNHHQVPVNKPRCPVMHSMSDG